MVITFHLQTCLKVECNGDGDWQKHRYHKICQIVLSITSEYGLLVFCSYRKLIRNHFVINASTSYYNELFLYCLLIDEKHFLVAMRLKLAVAFNSFYSNIVLLFQIDCLIRTKIWIGIKLTVIVKSNFCDSMIV